MSDYEQSSIYTRNAQLRVLLWKKVQAFFKAKISYFLRRLKLLFGRKSVGFITMKSLVYSKSSRFLKKSLPMKKFNIVKNITAVKGSQTLIGPPFFVNLQKKQIQLPSPFLYTRIGSNLKINLKKKKLYFFFSELLKGNALRVHNDPFWKKKRKPWNKKIKKKSSQKRTALRIIHTKRLLRISRRAAIRKQKQKQRPFWSFQEGKPFLPKPFINRKKLKKRFLWPIYKNYKKPIYIFEGYRNKARRPFWKRLRSGLFIKYLKRIAFCFKNYRKKNFIHVKRGYLQFIFYLFKLLKPSILSFKKFQKTNVHIDLFKKMDSQLDYILFRAFCFYPLDWIREIIEDRFVFVEGRAVSAPTYIVSSNSFISVNMVNLSDAARPVYKVHLPIVQYLQKIKYNVLGGLPFYRFLKKAVVLSRVGGLMKSLKNTQMLLTTWSYSKYMQALQVISLKTTTRQLKVSPFLLLPAWNSNRRCWIKKHNVIRLNRPRTPKRWKVQIKKMWKTQHLPLEYLPFIKKNIKFSNVSKKKYLCRFKKFLKHASFVHSKSYKPGRGSKKKKKYETLFREYRKGVFHIKKKQIIYTLLGRSSYLTSLKYKFSKKNMRMYMNFLSIAKAPHRNRLYVANVDLFVLNFRSIKSKPINSLCFLKFSFVRLFFFIDRCRFLFIKKKSATSIFCAYTARLFRFLFSTGRRLKWKRHLILEKRKKLVPLLKPKQESHYIFNLLVKKAPTKYPQFHFETFKLSQKKGRYNSKFQSVRNKKPRTLMVPFIPFLKLSHPKKFNGFFRPKPFKEGTLLKNFFLSLVFRRFLQSMKMRRRVLRFKKIRETQAKWKRIWFGSFRGTVSKKYNKILKKNQNNKNRRMLKNTYKKTALHRQFSKKEYKYLKNTQGPYKKKSKEFEQKRFQSSNQVKRNVLKKKHKDRKVKKKSKEENIMSFVSKPNQWKKYKQGKPPINL